jgi:hypothetical protein
MTGPEHLFRSWLGCKTFASKRPQTQPHPRLVSPLGARAAPHASRPRARQTAQPHAQKYVELSDFGRIRSRSANKELSHESWRNQADGRLNRTR